MPHNPFFQFEHFKQSSFIKHFVSYRYGGVSLPPYDSLNLGFQTEDLPQNVLQNRQILAQAVDIPLSNFCFAQQTHSANVYAVEPQDKGKGSQDYASAIAATDALITASPNICLTTLAADCVLILLFDPQTPAIASIHAGWRGTLAQIVRQTIEKMRSTYQTKPESILAGICPAISVQNYEVGEELTEKVFGVFGTTEGYLWHNPTTQRKHLDLHFANQQQLIQMGVPKENIITATQCTFAHQDKYFSSRRDKGITGRFGAGICLQTPA